jgi:UDP-N-acetylglucosamine 2-epimerase (non-hydrolysing)
VNTATTRRRDSDVQVSPSHGLELAELPDHIDSLHLDGNARIDVTESGGVREGSFTLEVPCLTVRLNTEQPERVEAVMDPLPEPEESKETLDTVCDDDALRDRMTGRPSLCGDTNARERIVVVLSGAVAGG